MATIETKSYLLQIDLTADSFEKLRHLIRDGFDKDKWEDDSEMKKFAKLWKETMKLETENIIEK